MTLRKQLPATPAFEIRRSSIQGKGGFATRRIRKGERIGEYVGEIITQGEADRRYDDDAMSRHHTFLFAVTQRTVIDAAIGGNDTRFINHSCTPNCEAVIEGRRVFIDALRAIPKSAELFYDYSYERERGSGPEADAQYPCHCGTSKCRGTILVPMRRRRRKSRRKTREKTRRASTRGASNTRRPKTRGRASRPPRSSQRTRRSASVSRARSGSSSSSSSSSSRKARRSTV